ncbi:PTS mannose/fructose/sorbose transporter subunit IIAB [Lactobacillus intestinalis]|uniref:PTS mannose/fructose/sorbose transporter subunit IIAB n=1 Tax=Lactobacillus intestinalis TaxID=151781 RepID=UPI0026702022|nr:PTS mannose/fructose/sorbose transporter subunit IIAB [Lactobacillus intestinalis]
MNNFLLVSHGEYAKSTLASCEMIAGKLSNVKAIAFKQTMNQDDLLDEITKVAVSFDTAPTIIVDIAGGTPANASLRYQKAHPDVEIYSGLCLPLLLAAVMGTPMSEAIEQAKANLAPVGDAHENKPEPKKTPAKTDNQNAEVEPQTMHNIRIDERLIHGQVATMWTNALHLTRLMVIGDDIVKNDIQKTALKTACPHGVHLSILTAKGAARRINSGKYQGQTVLILVKNPGVLKELVDNGVKLPEINIGNMSTKANSRQVAKSVAVTEEDIENFKYLDQKGCHLYHQMVPAEDKEDFMKLLSK